MHGSGHLGDPSQRDSSLTVVDTDSMTVKARIPLCPAANGAGLALNEQALYATAPPMRSRVVDLTAVHRW